MRSIKLRHKEGLENITLSAIKTQADEKQVETAKWAKRQLKVDDAQPADRFFRKADISRNGQLEGNKLLFLNSEDFYLICVAPT